MFRFFFVSSTVQKCLIESREMLISSFCLWPISSKILNFLLQKRERDREKRWAENHAKQLANCRQSGVESQNMKMVFDYSPYRAKVRLKRLAFHEILNLSIPTQFEHCLKYSTLVYLPVWVKLFSHLHHVFNSLIFIIIVHYPTGCRKNHFHIMALDS